MRDIVNKIILEIFLKLRLFCDKMINILDWKYVGFFIVRWCYFFVMLYLLFCVGFFVKYCLMILNKDVVYYDWLIVVEINFDLRYF